MSTVFDAVDEPKLSVARCRGTVACKMIDGTTCLCRVLAEHSIALIR